MVLLGAGIALIALGVPGGLVVGPALIVAWLLVKAAGLLTLDAGPTPPAGSGRRVTTLGTAPTGGGATAGRTSALRRARTARAARATARATEAARAAALRGSA